MKCLVMVLMLCGAVLGEETDAYGGLRALPCQGGVRPHFYTEKIAGQWWLCTPAGNAFFEVGVYNVVPHQGKDFQEVELYRDMAAKYASGATKSGLMNWCLQTARRLKKWGFNSVEYAYSWIQPNQTWNSWETADHTIPEKMAYMDSVLVSHYAMLNSDGYAAEPIKELIWGTKTSTYNGWRASPMADYYDSNFGAWMDGYWTKRPHGTVNQDWSLGIMIDDGDYIWWAAWGEDCPGVPVNDIGLHLGWVTMVTAPTQTAAIYRNQTMLYKDPKVYTKAAFAEYLQNRYATIDALNTAWGSSYTTFGTTGRGVTGESVATGDNTGTTFTKVLASPQPSPFSVQVLVDGVPVAGDDGNGKLLGAALTSGKVAYATGDLSITFASAPRFGAAITVNYVSCGFGCGSGVLDEDGAHSWVPRLNRRSMVGGTAALREDADKFLEQYARVYFGTIRAKLNKYWAGYLYVGPSTIGGRAQVLRAAGDYLDVMRIGTYNWTAINMPARMEFILTNSGDKPWTAWVGAKVSPDGYFAADPRGGACLTGNFATQEQRGAFYESTMRMLLSSNQFVGMQFWELYDNQGECANWGLMTRRDNPYDGVSARVATGVDEWGYPTGGERQDFGDFLTGARAANALWHNRWQTGVRIEGNVVVGGGVKIQ